MDCQPRCPRGKMETATTFGRVMSSVVQPSRRKNKNAETIACFYSIFLSLSHSWESLHSHHYSLLPSSQSTCLQCSLPASRDVLQWLKGQFSIIQLMNTERSQVDFIKKVQRSQTVICKFSPAREGNLGKQARRRGGIKKICFIFKLIQIEKG